MIGTANKWILFRIFAISVPTTVFLIKGEMFSIFPEYTNDYLNLCSSEHDTF